MHLQEEGQARSRHRCYPSRLTADLAAARRGELVEAPGLARVLVLKRAGAQGLRRCLRYWIATATGAAMKARRHAHVRAGLAGELGRGRGGASRRTLGSQGGRSRRRRARASRAEAATRVRWAWWRAAGWIYA
jgi:hypothetical protein